MDLRQLTYFVAVAEAGHLGRAAERLNLSQPPLTRQIQHLEDELAVKLFDRTSRGMSLTAAGHQLLQHARTLLALTDQAVQQTQLAARGEIGRLDVGLYGSAIFGLVPQVLAAFRSAHPDVELVLHHAQTPLLTVVVKERATAALRAPATCSTSSPASWRTPLASTLNTRLPTAVAVGSRKPSVTL